MWNPYTSLFVRTKSVLRVKFAYRADAGTTLYFGIKDAFGNVIGKKELTFVARKAIINAVTIGLKTYDFVKVFFQTTNGAAVVGLTEVISHNHEFEDGNGYPIYDRNNCATIRFCKSCGFEVDFIKHNLTVVKEVACETDGLEEYSWLKGRLLIRVVVEATGHEYEEIHTFATCETEGKSVYHKCRVCGDIYEKPEDIVTFAPLGHGESEWITEIAPTTRSEGLQRKYCNRCKKMTEERVVPKLNDSDYDKYILEDPEKTDGYLYRYTSKIYGTFTEYEPKSNSDKVLLIVLPIFFVVALVASVALFIIFTEKGKSK